ncbi:MAG: 1-aminocyclopropane-1-carboxylate deaminase [Kordiimonas sp.]|nr:1-aminocyclopropane-1-carboxylate deaminase [Kordiimonas sp.]
MTSLSQRVSSLSPFLAMDVQRAAQQERAKGRHIVNMSIGEPGQGLPQQVTETIQARLGQEKVGYTDATGNQDLRARIARHYDEWYGVKVSPERIFITTGSSSAFLFIFLACFDIGQKVGIAQPGYPAYPNLLKGLGLEPVYLPGRYDFGYQPSIEDLKAVPDLAGLMIASPNNPTGSMLSNKDQMALMDYCRTAGITYISDEIYHGLHYGDKPSTALAFDDQAIVINSFSKYFLMTGWRLGWMVLPEHFVRPIEKIAQSFIISPPTLSQHAAVNIFDCYAELDQAVAHYRTNRDLLLQALPTMGFNKIAPADGAFYLYIDISDFSNDSMTFCQEMLSDIGVATTPGIDFDPDRGHRFMRISYSTDTAEIKEGIRRLQNWERLKA